MAGISRNDLGLIFAALASAVALGIGCLADFLVYGATHALSVLCYGELIAIVVLSLLWLSGKLEEIEERLDKLEGKK